MIKLALCASCAEAEVGFAHRLRLALAHCDCAVEVQQADCMSGCARGPAMAVRASGKTAYLFGEIGVEDIPDILHFVRLYDASLDGTFEDARPLGGLRMKALARIPG